MAAQKPAETEALLHHHHKPAKTAYSTYQREIYSQLRPPLFTTNPTAWETIAKRKVPRQNFFYVAGSAGLSRTCTANTDAFDRYRLRPHMLLDNTLRDTSIELFGTKLPNPLLLAPIGVQEIMHKDGERATARAAKNCEVPIVLSTASCSTLEEVAKQNGDGERWYQLYWPHDDEVTASLLQRAWASGYKVLVVTADTFSLGWRPADLDTAYLPFIWGTGCAIGFSDPVFQRKYAEAQAKAKIENAKLSLWRRIKDTVAILLRPRNLFTTLRLIWNVSTVKKSQAWVDVAFSSTYRTWEELPILRKHWPGPIIIKGIQTVEDAHKCIDSGMDGFVVSNHGGRQVDSAIASLDALAAIGDDQRVKSSGITILFDSGIRNGSDVLKALALGAKAVLLGRPYMYGLAIAGQAGVEHVVRTILGDMDNTLGLIGKQRIDQLSRSDLDIANRSNS